MMAAIPADFCECIPVLEKVQNIVGQLEESIKSVQVDIPEKMSMEILNLRTALDSLEMPTDVVSEPESQPEPLKPSDDCRLQLEHAERNLGKKLSSLFQQQFSELQKSWENRLDKIRIVDTSTAPQTDLSSQLSALEKSITDDSSAFEDHMKQLTDKATEAHLKSKYSDASSKAQTLEIAVAQRKRDLLLLQQEVTKLGSQISKLNQKSPQIVQPLKRKKEKPKRPLLSHEELMYNAQRERLISYQREWFATKDAVSQILFEVESKLSAYSEKLDRVEKAVEKAQTLTETVWRMEDRREQVLIEARQFTEKKAAELTTKTDNDEISAFSAEMTKVFAEVSDEIRESEQSVCELSRRIPR